MTVILTRSFWVSTKLTTLGQRPGHPQTNGICARFRHTCSNEFYKITFRKKIYRELGTLQADLDAFLKHYNNERTHQGKRCQGRTPMQAFLYVRELA